MRDNTNDSDNKHEEGINILLKAAGPRVTLEQKATQRIHDALFEQWQGTIKKRKQQRRRGLIISLSSAATIAALSLLIWTALSPKPKPLEVVAQVERIAGVAYVYNSATQELERNTKIFPGQTIQTAENSRLALRLQDQQSLRLDANTKLAILGYRKFELIHGAVYFDSLKPSNESSIAIYTPAGVARDIGTQFEVRIIEDDTRVRVRDGEVSLTQRGLIRNTQRIHDNEQLIISDGAAIRSQIDSGHEDWQWAQDIAPEFKLEGSNLHEFLTWVTRESGWELKYGKPEVKDHAKQAILHGSIEGLSIRDALTNVTATSNVEYSVNGNILLCNSFSSDGRL